MIKKIGTIVSILALSGTLLVNTAYADDASNDNGIYYSSYYSDKDSDSNFISYYSDDSTVAEIYLISDPSQSPRSIKVSEDQETLGDFFNENELNITSWSSIDGTQIDPNRVISKGSKYLFKKVEYSSKMSQIDIDYPVVEEENYNAPVGERLVIQKGVKGVAILTSVTNSDNEVTDSISVISKPIEEIVSVGANIYMSRSQGAGYTGSDSSWGKTSETLKKEILDDNPGNKLIETLVDQVGKQYVWGATGPDSFDCSGLVLWSFTKNGYYGLPRVANDQGHYSQPIDFSDLQPGDVLWTSSHIAVYVGDGLVIHAADSRWGVVITDLSWFIRNGFHAGRLPGGPSLNEVSGNSSNIQTQF